MTAPLTPREALADRLQHVMATMQNDDLSRPGSEDRSRHSARYETIADVLEYLRAAPASAMREATIEECAKVADYFAAVCIDTTTAEKDEYARERAGIVAKAIRALAAAAPAQTAENLSKLREANEFPGSLLAASSPSGDAVRETIARIIDPRNFEMHEISANQYTTDGINEALRKADAILASLPPRGDAVREALKATTEGARLSNWLADYAHDLMEDGDFDQEAAEIQSASQWIADALPSSGAGR